MEKKPGEPEVDSREDKETKIHEDTDKITEIMNVLSDDVSVSLLERIAETGTYTKEDIAGDNAAFESLKRLKDLELIKIEGNKITLTKKGKKSLEFMENIEKVMKWTDGGELHERLYRT